MSTFKNSISIKFLQIFLLPKSFSNSKNSKAMISVISVMSGAFLWLCNLKQIHCGDKIPKTYVSEGHEIEIAFAVVNMYRDDRGLIYKFTYEATRARKSKRKASEFYFYISLIQNRNRKPNPYFNPNKKYSN